jgi:hypothetical protein
MQTAKFSGADVRAFALASLRATREGEVIRGYESLPCIIGTPVKGERLGRQIFDGREELAIFPGDLPSDPASVFSASWTAETKPAQFVRFRPPQLPPPGFGHNTRLPHIRLDSALNFLIGDWLS